MSFRLQPINVGYGNNQNNFFYRSKKIIATT